MSLLPCLDIINPMSSPTSESRLILSNEQVRSLAKQFGTPLYVVDETHLRDRIRRYKAAFESAWPGGELTFATKANSTAAIVQIAHQEGCLIDCASEGEFRVALMAGVPANRCHLHGNNKKADEIQFAMEQGIGQIVADCFEEIETIAQIGGNTPEVILRLAPGVDPKTNAKMSTGQADTKFGFNIADGSAEKAVVRCLELGLPLGGYHCHVGSQVLDPGAQISGGEILASFAVDMLNKHGFKANTINVGGGLGIRYTDADNPMEVEEFCQAIADNVRKALEGSGITPRLVQEPGRSIIGESGVTIYTVGVVKTVPTSETSTRTYVAVDGGLSDNPRPAFYGSKYTVLHHPAEDRARAANDVFTVSGKHCETDKLFPDINLPGDVQKGDFLQVLCTGAYNSSMASNYNRYRRPETVLIQSNGTAVIIQRKESWEELLAREVLPGTNS